MTEFERHQPSNPEQFKEYQRLIADGYEPLLASFHATGSMPALRTDTYYARGIVSAQTRIGSIGATVDTMDMRSQIKRICEQKNLDCDGIVKHKAERFAPPPRIPLGEDIIQESIEEMTTLDPGMAFKPQEELREMVIEKHAVHPELTD